MGAGREERVRRDRAGSVSGDCRPGQGERIPRRHPAKINTFLDLYDPGDDLEERLLTWLRRRSDAQYVDIRGDEVNIPHEQFDKDDAERILSDAETVIDYVTQEIA